MSGSRANQAAINRRANGANAGKNTLKSLTSEISNPKLNTVTVPIQQVISIHDQILKELKTKIEKFESNDNMEEKQNIENIITENSKLKEDISTLNNKFADIEKKYSELQGMITQLSVQIVSNK